MSQTAPRVAVQPGGVFVTAWVDRRNGGNDIYYQRFQADGSAIGSNLLINDDTAIAEQFEVALASEASGRYVVVWKDFRNGSYPFKPDVYLSSLDSLGSVLGANQNLTSAPPDSAIETPDVSLRPDGSGVVVWADYRNRNWDIYGQLFSSAGLTVGAAFKINDDISASQQHAPSVSVSSQNWFVVSWYDNRRGHDDIYAQVFSEESFPVGGNLLVNDDPLSARQAFPDVAADGSGHFIITWTDWRNGVYPDNPDIYARRYSRDGVALDRSFRVNADASTTPQTDPAIAGDRLGNSAIVWSDSGDADWDIRGQLFDQLGQRSAESFPVNAETSGRQVQPDVAMDGFHMRVVWADKRSGDFDIFAAIKKYNEPTLTTRPGGISFRMHTTGPALSSQMVEIVNSGIGSIGYRVKDTVSWLSVSPISGSTPDSLTVSITASSLPVGSYTAVLPLVDETALDSSNSLVVTLQVTTAHIAFAHDTVRITALAQTGDPGPFRVAVQNSGSGYLNWSAREDTQWLTLSDTSGSNSDSITLVVSTLGLGYGERTAPIIISDALADNSPETLFVEFIFTGDLPILSLAQDTLRISQQRNTLITRTLAVENLGAGTLSWQAAADDAWIEPLIATGGAGDSVRYRVDAHTLPVGEYLSRISVTDTGAFNDSDAIIVSLEVTSADSLIFGGDTIGVGEIGLLSIDLKTVDSIYGLTIRVALSAGIVAIDSIICTDSTLSEYFQPTLTIDTLREQIVLSLLPRVIGGGGLPPQQISGALTVAYHSVGGEGIVSTNQMFFSDSSVTFTDALGIKYLGLIRAGEIIVGSTTAVTEPTEPVLPSVFRVEPNYPNPFNGATTIRAHIPRGGEVVARVFNLLGQVVRRLESRFVPAGELALGWDGADDQRRPLPSGVYFYEILWQGRREVRRALLIK